MRNKSCFYGLDMTIVPVKSAKHVNMNRTIFFLKSVIVNFRKIINLVPFITSIAVFKNALILLKKLSFSFDFYTQCTIISNI